MTISLCYPITKIVIVLNLIHTQMKRKKIIVITMVVFATLFGTKSVLWAQKTQADKVNHITERMTKKLDLTQEQKEKVYVINQKKVEARLNMRNNKSEMTRKERKKHFKQKAAEWKNDLKAVLNEAQLKKINIQ